VPKQPAVGRGPLRNSTLGLGEVMEQFLEPGLQRRELLLHTILDGSATRNLGDQMWDDLNTRGVCDRLRAKSDASSDIGDAVMTDIEPTTETEPAGASPAGGRPACDQHRLVGNARTHASSGASGSGPVCLRRTSATIPGGLRQCYVQSVHLATRHHVPPRLFSS
jgi:hypothetical protein